MAAAAAAATLSTCQHWMQQALGVVKITQLLLLMVGDWLALLQSIHSYRHLKLQGQAHRSLLPCCSSQPWW
jgi:hypothetical protein